MSAGSGFGEVGGEDRCAGRTARGWAALHTASASRRWRGRVGAEAGGGSFSAKTARARVEVRGDEAGRAVLDGEHIEGAGGAAGGGVLGREHDEGGGARLGDGEGGEGDGEGDGEEIGRAHV